MSALEERRQWAREAFYDAMAIGDVVESRAVESAIETATRVRITPEAMHAYRVAVLRDGANAGVVAALRELGFEVEE